MDLFKHSLYINLEKRTDKKEYVLEQLEKLDIKAKRFNAIENEYGAIGCTLSHIRCLEIAKYNNYPQVFICEDDIMFLDVSTFKNSLKKFVKNNSINWDVLIISGNNHRPYHIVNDYCVKVNNCLTTTGYIVKQHYYNTLIENMLEGLIRFLKFPKYHYYYALDVWWSRLQKHDNWYLITPLTIVQAPSYSDIEKQNKDYVDCMLSLD